MTDSDADYYAETMTDRERRVIVNCGSMRTPSYEAIAERLGLSYDEVRIVGVNLQGMGAATIQPVRRGNRYDGSGLFLNDKGAKIKKAVLARYPELTPRFAK